MQSAVQHCCVHARLQLPKLRSSLREGLSDAPSSHQTISFNDNSCMRGVEILGTIHCTWSGAPVCSACTCLICSEFYIWPGQGGHSLTIGACVLLLNGAVIFLNVHHLKGYIVLAMQSVVDKVITHTPVPGSFIQNSDTCVHECWPCLLKQTLHFDDMQGFGYGVRTLLQATRICMHARTYAGLISHTRI